ncbi:hypothetical protein CONPUDRAFT_152897 [Coniophora puteana RWD-64-598 SS2]|uniref:Uncharacterized protein n=1 Tax=Coniophora puteana (strain RWD-64-598) TaxID=741705 RepID=A0A5M3MS71_CONPW|nr:uncharacterized protein CONPUDRAFT_152897 [Coniophora puteana RWD-64-598 SS2]EIW82009.1 hypothetical protein CONPUDRAFT_152897 [Coniophora puteana RWD-64-598 SS2]
MFFKHTIKELSLRLATYMVEDIAQLAAFTGKQQVTLLWRLIHEQILHRLCKLLQSCGVPQEEYSFHMEWADHEGTVIKFGIELVGFPGGQIMNLNNIASIKLLHQTEIAI